MSTPLNQTIPLNKLGDFTFIGHNLDFFCKIIVAIPVIAVVYIIAVIVFRHRVDEQKRGFFIFASVVYTIFASLIAILFICSIPKTIITRDFMENRMESYKSIQWDDSQKCIDDSDSEGSIRSCEEISPIENGYRKYITTVADNNQYTVIVKDNEVTIKENEERVTPAMDDSQKNLW